MMRELALLWNNQVFAYSGGPRGAEANARHQGGKKIDGQAEARKKNTGLGRNSRHVVTN